jgi:hypothetical protein
MLPHYSWPPLCRSPSSHFPTAGACATVHQTAMQSWLHHNLYFQCCLHLSQWKPPTHRLPRSKHPPLENPHELHPGGCPSPPLPNAKYTTSSPQHLSYFNAARPHHIPSRRSRLPRPILMDQGDRQRPLQHMTWSYFASSPQTSTQVHGHC